MNKRSNAFNETLIIVANKVDEGRSIVITIIYQLHAPEIVLEAKEELQIAAALCKVRIAL